MKYLRIARVHGLDIGGIREIYNLARQWNPQCKHVAVAALAPGQEA
ncbi:Uncharacterised protein [Mycobacteroides abscessus subsp. abscessus]|nr:Uncharacterised protein [Mycobacteroides abscessus subsp. abscessus]SKU95140.1 Uncharacterised protein [Mycobacteroides abscessus subsp. abscessus]